MTDLDLNGNPGTFGKYPSPHMTGACGIEGAHSEEDHDDDPCVSDPSHQYHTHDEDPDLETEFLTDTDPLVKHATPE